MSKDLYIATGPKAQAHLRNHGLRLPDIRAMLGASGGPKWLVLNQLDRYLAPRLTADSAVSMDLLGTSIGSWRFACYAQKDPLAAFERFEGAYFAQSFTAAPSATEISRECGQILDALLGNAHAEIAANKHLRLHTIANRCRPFVLNANGNLDKWRLAFSAAANFLGREQLRHFFERVLFTGQDSQLPFTDPRFGLEQTPFSADNLRSALMATASIPVLMEAVRDIPGTTGGACVDGGILDYHFDTALPYADGLVLYLHFSPSLIPGWFDKLLPWRRPSGRCLDNVLLITPSREFIARLPGGKIPDRNDFLRMDNGTRLKAWRSCLTETESLAEALDRRLLTQSWDDVMTLA